MPSVLQTLLATTRPLRFGEWCRRRYGDVVRLRLFPIGTVVTVTGAGLVDELIRGDPEVFRAGDVSGAMDFVVGARSILLLEGAEHGRRRRRLLPPFGERRVGRYRSRVDAIVADAVDGWPQGPVELLPRFQEMTLEVIMQVCFGITDGPRLDRLRVLLPRLLHVNPLLLLFHGLRRDLGPGSPGRRLRRVEREVDEILVGEIRRRRAEPVPRDRDDVLSTMLAARDEDGEPLGEEELRDNLVTLLVVGHETTAGSLAWAFERLVRSPDDLRRLRDDLARGDGEFLEAVINETLRVRPVIPDVARTLLVPADVGGYRIPAGTMVALSLASVAAAPGTCPVPSSFRPERFLDGTGPDEFMPFGSGAHRCLGANFALMTMRAVLTGVLTRRDVLTTGSKDENPLSTGPIMIPSRGARVIVGAPRTPPGDPAPAPSGCPVATTHRVPTPARRRP